MAMIKCRECGAEASSKAAACPKCGAPPAKKGIGWLGAITCGCLGFGLAAFVLVGMVGTALKQARTEGTKPGAARPGGTPVRGSAALEAEKAPTEGDTVSVGYTSYLVHSARWSRTLSTNQILNQAPNAMYLIVELSVRNDDVKARTIPPLKLVDDRGAEHDADSRAMLIPGAIGLLQELNPSVLKRGTVVFDVPQGRRYSLKVSGGYWSSDSAMIVLKPR